MNMAQFGRFYIPPWRAVVNVAWETVKSTIPEKSKLIRRNQTEMASMPGGTYGTETAGYTNRVAEDGFTGQEDGYAVKEDGFTPRQSYQQSRGATMSMASGGSFDEFGGGEGKSRHKINEWQAAWNVTNAIQVGGVGLTLASLHFVTSNEISISTI